MESTTKAHLSGPTILSLAQAAFGNHITLTCVEELNKGWYNTAYALTLNDGGKTVLKISPSDDAAILSYEHDIMRAEVETMQLVASNPEIPVPHIWHSDFSQKLIPHNFYFMDYIEAPVWHDIEKELSPAQNWDIAYQLGEITSYLNSYRHNLFGYYALEPKYTTWAQAIQAMFTMLLEDADSYDINLPVNRDDVFTWLDMHSRVFADVTEPQLVHWDLWQGNVFVDMDGERPRICGLIDFERVYWGDPLGEAFFRRGGNPAFKAGYGKPMLETRSQRIRNLFYDLYLYMIMVVEDGPRQYSDRGVVQWAREQLDQTVNELRAVD